MSFHGQSSYTPEKQQQLAGLLSACRKAWENNKHWTYPTRLFIDCMAGSGHTSDGRPGSPLIFQDYAETLPRAKVIWCDENKAYTQQLEEYRRGNTEILTGRFQEEVLRWLKDKTLNLRGKLMGVIYLDDNGCKQVWNDDGLLRWVMENHPAFDVAIHFSETAWARSSGASVDWALDKSAMSVMQMILEYKPASVIYTPDSTTGKRHGWRLIYGVNSGRMNLTGSSRMKLKDYLDLHMAEQVPLFS